MKKLSKGINRFQFEIPLLKVKEKVVKDKDGNEKTERFVEGVASSTNIDLHGDRMAPSAIESMADSLKQHVILLNAEHDKSWQSEIGEITELDVVKEGKNYNLVLEAKLDEMSKSNDLWYALTEKQKKLGLSIGGYVKEYEMVKEGEDEDGFPKWHRIFKIIELDHVAVTSSPANPKAWVAAIEKSLENSTNEIKERVMKMSEEEKRDLVLKLIVDKSDEEIKMILADDSAERKAMATSPLKTEKEEKKEVEETKTADDSSESSETVTSENGDGEKGTSDNSDDASDEAKDDDAEETKSPDEADDSKESDSKEDEADKKSVKGDKKSSEEKSDDDKESSEEAKDGDSKEEADSKESEDTDSEASDEASDDSSDDEKTAKLSKQLRAIAEDLSGDSDKKSTEKAQIPDELTKTMDNISKTVEEINSVVNELSKKVEALEDQPAGRKTTAVTKGIGPSQEAPEKSLKDALKAADEEFKNHPNLFAIKQRIRKEYADNEWTE